MTASWRFVLLLIAVILLLLVAIIGGQVFSDSASKPETIWLLLGGGLAAGFAAFLAPPRP